MWPGKIIMIELTFIFCIALAVSGLKWSDADLRRISPVSDLFPNITRQHIVRGLSPHGYRLVNCSHAIKLLANTLMAQG